MNLPYADEVKGVLCGTHGAEYIIFTRKRQGFSETFRVLAQNQQGLVLKVSGVETDERKPNFVVHLTSRDGETIQFSASAYRNECYDGVTYALRWVALATKLPPIVTEFMPDDFWDPLKGEISTRVFELAEFPEEFLGPIRTDFPYCSFHANGALIVVLFIRRFGDRPPGIDIAMAAAQSGQVFRLRSFEIRGLISKKLLMFLESEAGGFVPMGIPLSALDPNHGKQLKDFASNPCLKKLGEICGISRQEIFAKAEFVWDD